MTRRKKRKHFLDEDGGIKISRTDIHSIFQNNTESEIQQSQRIYLHYIKQCNVTLQLWYKSFVYYFDISSRIYRPDKNQHEGMPPRELI